MQLRIGDGQNSSKIAQALLGSFAIYRRRIDGNFQPTIMHAANFIRPGAGLNLHFKRNARR